MGFTILVIISIIAYWVERAVVVVATLLVPAALLYGIVTKKSRYLLLGLALLVPISMRVADNWKQDFLAKKDFKELLYATDNQLYSYQAPSTPTLTYYYSSYDKNLRRSYFYDSYTNSGILVAQFDNRFYGDAIDPCDIQTFEAYTPLFNFECREVGTSNLGTKIWAIVDSSGKIYRHVTVAGDTRIGVIYTQVSGYNDAPTPSSSILNTLRPQDRSTIKPPGVGLFSNIIN